MLITDNENDRDQLRDAMQRRQDKAEFNAHCRACTDAQLLAVVDKERTAGRQDYVIIAKQEMIARGIA